MFNKYGTISEEYIKIRELYEKVIGDKKRTGDYINVILVEEIGKSQIGKMELDKVKEIIRIGMN